MFSSSLIDTILSCSSDASTVEDHFAKSLGSTWFQLQAKQQEAATATAAAVEEEEDVLVDDHFAKALGSNTWLKIKAENVRNAGSAASSPSTPTAPSNFPSSHMQQR